MGARHPLELRLELAVLSRELLNRTGRALRLGGEGLLHIGGATPVGQIQRTGRQNRKTEDRSGGNRGTRERECGQRATPPEFSVSCRFVRKTGSNFPHPGEKSLPEPIRDWRCS